MYIGEINKRLVYSCHPLLVIQRKGVAASFSSLKGANDFIGRQGLRSSLIYRHNGLNWDKITRSRLRRMVRSGIVETR